MSRTSSRSEPIWSAGPASTAAMNSTVLPTLPRAWLIRWAERVNLGRLRLAGDDQALAAMGGQVAGQRGDPAGVVGEPFRELCIRRPAAAPTFELGGDGLREQARRPATARPAGDRPRHR